MRLQVVTPLHIGSGDNAPPTTYTYTGNRAHFLTPDALLAALGPEAADRFTRWLDEEARTFRGNVRNLWFDRFIDRVGPEARQKAIEAARYSLPVHARRPSQIELCLKTADLRPYIPGTSTKGFLRTAIIFDVISQDERLQDLLLETIMKLPLGRGAGPRRVRAELSQQLEGIALRNAAYGESKPAQLDALKFLDVPDTLPGVLGDLFVAPVTVRLGRGGSLTLWRESLKPGTVLQSPVVPGRIPWVEVGKQAWVDVSERKLGIQAGRATWAATVEAARRFSDMLLRSESQEFPQPPLRQRLLDLNRSEDGVLLLLGRDKGLIAQTVVLALRQDQRQQARRKLAELYRTIAKGFGGRTSPERFPVVRRSVTWPDDLREAAGPPGWVRLEAWP